MKLGAVVTGHGEVEAVPVLLRRLAEQHGVHDLMVPRPFRVPEGKLKKPEELATEGPDLLRRARGVAPGVRVEVVMARRECESWFLAAATSIAGERTLPNDLEPPPDFEGIRNAKGWLDAKMSHAYAETIDQPAFSARIDLAAARANSSSFDKLARAVATLLGVASRPPPSPQFPPSPP
jgi:hypothetical protein